MVKEGKHWPQIADEDYDNFFSGVRSLKPKFYMFMEGVNPGGYEKIPNHLLKGHHHRPNHGW
jgi:hypothetical protein